MLCITTVYNCILYYYYILLYTTVYYYILLYTTVYYCILLYTTVLLLYYYYYAIVRKHNAVELLCVLLDRVYMPEMWPSRGSLNLIFSGCHLCLSTSLGFGRVEFQECCSETLFRHPGCLPTHRFSPSFLFLHNT